MGGMVPKIRHSITGSSKRETTKIFLTRAHAALCDDRCKENDELKLRKVDRSDFQFGRIIGHGSFSVVYSAIERKSGHALAVKMVRKEGQPDLLSSRCTGQAADNEVYMDAMRREIECVRALGSHDNIVPVEGVSDSGDMIVMGLGIIDLYGMLQDVGTLSMPSLREWSKNILSAVSHMHAIGFVHQDVKSSNLLIFPNNIAKLCDFGLATAIEKSMPADHEICTLWYRPPEILLGAGHYCPKVDEWGAGCVILEMISGMPPFRGCPGHECCCSKSTHGNFNSNQVSKIFALLGTPEETCYLRTLDCYPHVCTMPPVQKSLHAKITACLQKVRPHQRKEREVSEAEVRDWITLLSGLLHYDPANRTPANEALNNGVFRRPDAGSFKDPSELQQPRRGRTVFRSATLPTKLRPRSPPPRRQLRASACEAELSRAACGVRESHGSADPSRPVGSDLGRLQPLTPPDVWNTFAERNSVAIKTGTP